MNKKLIFAGIIVALGWLLSTKANQFYSGGPGRSYGGQTFDPAILAKAQADESARESAVEKDQFEKNFIPENPWREVNGETNYIKINGQEFCGKVVDVTKDGVRIDGEWGDFDNTGYFPNSYDYKDFFVANYPFDVVTDHIIESNEHQMARYVGTYTYSTVNGGSRTIQKLDYGTPCEPPAELVKQKIEAKLAADVIVKKRADEAQVKVITWLQTQATNGSASAQCSLGEHYLTGQGCETNVEQGVYWLNKAAQQGSVEASNRLSTLRPQTVATR